MNAKGMISKTLLFERLMDNVTESVYFKDLDSRFIAINLACAKKFGLDSPEEAVGKSDFDFFAIEHAQKAMEDEQQIMATLEPIINIEEREVFLDEERTVKWNSTSKFPLLDDKGELIGTYGITKDVTEQKRHFEEVRRLKDQVEAILNSVPSMIFVKDYDGKYLVANQAAQDYFDPSLGDIVGKTDIDLGIDPVRAAKYIKSDRKVIDTKQPSFYSDEKTIRWDGTEMWHQTIKVPFAKSEDDEEVVLSVITDVSKRVKYENELTESLKVISAQNDRLSNFAHIVSHNLRNHAGGISMLIEMMSHTDSDSEKDKYFQLLSKAASRLKETISDLNEIMDKQNQVEVELKPIDFRSIYDGVKEVLEVEIRVNDVLFEEDIEPNLVFHYSTAYMESILQNLISNAIKYRKSNERPVLKIKVWKDEDRVRLTIQDNGKGMELDKYGDRLFGMYKTFHDNDNAKGIGLYITRNQIEALGGSIEVESEPGVGSTFFVDFGEQHSKRTKISVQN